MKKRAAWENFPLLLALTLAIPSFASGDTGLPAFSLNSVRRSGLRRPARGEIPPVPPPFDTGYYARANPGGVRLDSAIKVTIDGKEGKAEIKFPEVEYGEERAGCRASLFIRFIGPDTGPVLSWAAVVCSGRKYLGYKGASLELPGRSGSFTIKDESLSLGPLKTMLNKTHPWLVPAAEKDEKDLNRLCYPEFTEKMKAYAVKALPAEADGFSFKYDPEKKALTVIWHK